MNILRDTDESIRFRIGKPIADTHCSFVPLRNGMIIEAHSGILRGRTPDDFYDCTFDAALTPEQVENIYKSCPGRERTYHEMMRLCPDVCGLFLPIFLNDFSQFMRFQKVLAYLVMGGDFNNKYFFVWFGPFGHNAKTTILRIMQRLCNGQSESGGLKFWSTCDSEHVLSSRGSSGVFKDEKKSWLKKAAECRVVELGEAADNSSFIGNIIKTLAGGCDVVEYRDLYESFSTATAVAKWVLPCNPFPSFNSNDAPLVNRLFPIPFYSCFLKDADYENEMKTRTRENQPGHPIFINKQNRVEHPDWYRDTPESRPGAGDGLEIKLFFRDDSSMKEKFTSSQNESLLLNQLMMFLLDGARILHDPNIYAGRLVGKTSIIHPCWASVLEQKEIDNDTIGAFLDRRIEIVGWKSDNEKSPDVLPRSTKSYDPLKDRRVKVSTLYQEYSLSMKSRQEAAVDETQFSRNSEAYLFKKAVSLRETTGDNTIRVKVVKPSHSRRVADKEFVGVRLIQEDAFRVGGDEGGNIIAGGELNSND